MGIYFGDFLPWLFRPGFSQISEDQDELRLMMTTNTEGN